MTWRAAAEAWRARAAQLSRDIRVLHIAFRDSRMPLRARFVILAVTAYALSPVDLIPDAIPVLGYLDDLIILPLGVGLALRLTPAELLDDARDETNPVEPVGRTLRFVGLAIVLAAWCGVAIGLIALWSRVR